MDSKVYINGRIVPEAKARVSVFDRGLNYGDGLFETMRAEDGEALFLKEHLVRLKKGLKALGIRGGPVESLERGIGRGLIEKVLKANGLLKGPAYLKILVTRGEDRGGHLPSKGIEPTVIILSKPIDENGVKKARDKGIKAVILKGTYPAIPGVKTLNYLPNVLGKALAFKKGASEGIFAGEDSSLREGTSSNIFLVIKGVVKTPPIGKSLGEGVLPGVTRGAVMRLARKMGLKAVEAPLVIKDIGRCEEAFLTNSITGIVPLIGVDGKPLGGGRPGFTTRLLQEGL